VAVGAPHLAEFDLREYHLPRVRALNQPIDFGALFLGIQVVEFEKNRVAFAAVHTGAPGQITPDSLFE
jgi:hypothetical protein